MITKTVINTFIPLNSQFIDENQKNIKHSKLPTQKQITRILFWTKINHRVYGQFISQLLLYNPLLCPL